MAGKGEMRLVSGDGEVWKGINKIQCKRSPTMLWRKQSVSTVDTEVVQGCWCSCKREEYCKSSNI